MNEHQISINIRRRNLASLFHLKSTQSRFFMHENTQPSELPYKGVYTINRFPGWQKLWGFLPGWLHSELFPPEAYVPQKKIPKRKTYFWYKNTHSRPFVPFKVLFCPYLTLSNAKTPFLALVGEFYPPLSPLCLYFLPSCMPRCHNFCYPAFEDKARLRLSPIQSNINLHDHYQRDLPLLHSLCPTLCVPFTVQISKFIFIEHFVCEWGTAYLRNL